MRTMGGAVVEALDAAGARGMTSCDVCAPGSTAAAAGTAVCAPCVAGTVAPAAGR